MYLFFTNNTNDNNVCIICWENNKKIYKLKEIIIENICDCNIYVHSECLNIWIEKHNCCPICKKKYNFTQKKCFSIFCKYYNTITSLLLALLMFNTIYVIIVIIYENIFNISTMNLS
jgi:hypothetical protein